MSIITSFFKHTEEIWDKTMEINLKEQFLCCKVIIPQMLEKGTGNIINMSSQPGKVGMKDYQTYCARKFGIIGLTTNIL
ncbi:SDR family NAD(P)-dependent oxidoreductase [Tetragenococcus halophilus]|nr:SDR family NAD(P)-dependent oxidoreductase [Tetragenococcus halophilus]